MTPLDTPVELCIASQIRVDALNKVEVVPSTDRPEEWDSFVAKCSCSYRCLYRASRLLHGNHRSAFFVKRFDIILMTGTSKQKVGQFALVVTRRIKIFSDQLQILSEWNHLWREIMEKIFEKLGPGRYRYGSEWMTGPCRAESLQQFSNVSVLSIKKANLEVVDFSNWPDWNKYWTSVSKNVTRNYNKYVRENESQGITIVDLRYSFSFFFDISRIKSSTIIGKGLSSSKVKLYVKSALRYYVLSSHIKFVICAASNRRLDSFAACVPIGGNTYYLEGGSLKLKAGSGWFTLMSAIRQAYHAGKGKGLFIMGPVDDATAGKSHWIGLEKSRQQCRVVQRPVSVVDFERHEQHWISHK